VDETFVGEVGFADYRRDIIPSIDEMPEMGWVFASLFHGSGLALEATRAALDWGDENLRTHETVCIILPDHLRSLKLADKLGFRRPVEARCLLRERPSSLASAARPFTSGLSPAPRSA
jgi:RimJ/RimL family protein N-acetyltransferase